MSTAALLSILAALAQSASVGRRSQLPISAASTTGSPQKNDCENQIKTAAAGSSERPVDLSCWRLGQIALAMTRFEVRRLLGAPDFEADTAKDPANPDKRYDAAFYLFPRNLSTSLAVEPTAAARYRLLELVYANDAVVRIDNRPPQAVTRSACRGSKKDDGSTPDTNASVGGFTAFQAFAGVRQGDALASLRKKFGRLPEADASRTRYSYPKTPIVFDVDPKTNRISGFSLTSDLAKAADSASANVLLTIDPMTCLIRGYKISASRSRRIGPGRVPAMDQPSGISSRS